MMDDATRDQFLELLASILEQTQGVRADLIAVKSRLQQIELALANLEQTLVDTEVARLNHQLDWLNQQRLARCEADTKG